MVTLFSLLLPPHLRARSLPVSFLGGGTGMLRGQGCHAGWNWPGLVASWGPQWAQLRPHEQEEVGLGKEPEEETVSQVGGDRAHTWCDQR